MAARPTKLIVALIFALLAPQRAEATGGMLVDLAEGAVRLVRFQGSVTRVIVSNPRVADVKSLGDGSLQISGRKRGEATVLVYGLGAKPTKMIINVSVPVDVLAYQMRALFPGEQIVPRAMGNTVVLTGVVSDPVISERARKLAERYVGSGRRPGSVLNFLTIKGKQQVQLRVKIAEVSRTAMRELGSNLWFRKMKDGGTQTSGGLVAPGSQVGDSLNGNFTGAELMYQGEDPNQTPGMPVLTGPLTGTWGFHLATQVASTLPLSIALNVLQGKGLAKILSEPTSVAYSGHTADFLVGGEFPIFIPQGLGQAAIDFKRFGVQLSFTPTVLAGETIHLKMSVTVSERDKAGSVTLQGSTVPALATRRSDTTVRLRNGQSFAVAGLMHDRISSRSSKVPLLGDIPVLGMLFRQTSFEREERELVILVTAQLVRPLKPGEVPSLPGEDESSDPGAVAFFLLGAVDPEQKLDTKSKPAGPVGYAE